MAKLAPAIGFLAALVGGSRLSVGHALLVLAAVPMLAGAWMLVRRVRIDPVVEDVPVERAALRVYIRRTLAARAMGHLAQRSERAFARAERGAELLALQGFLPRPAVVQARLEVFDDKARDLGLAAAQRADVEDALRELEVVATSVERALPAA